MGWLVALITLEINHAERYLSPWGSANIVWRRRSMCLRSASAMS